MPNCSFEDARTACINYEAVNELDIQSTKISNTLLSRHDELQSQGQSNLRSCNSDSYSCVNMKGISTRNYKANHKGEMKFGKCLSCGKFHYRNSCAFRSAKCFKCGKIGYIQSVCKAIVHFASSSTKSCNLNLNNSDVSSDRLSLSVISKGNAHIQKRLYTSLDSFHDFIVDTGSIESIISLKNLKSLDPNVVNPRDFSFDTTIETLSQIFAEQSFLFNIRCKCLKMTKAGDDDWVKHAGLVNRECERFKLSAMTEDQFKYLVFVCSLQSPEDADIRTRILSKIEQCPKITLQEVTTECQRLVNFVVDQKYINQKLAIKILRPKVNVTPIIHKLVTQNKSLERSLKSASRRVFR
ncbi:unnamed protein product [Schistosoma margrebowiei]|uniref:Uncharacterized protein n=1 Tax=Schistosoma margrebowiei TaxID=48269 RepID=A0A183M448_9TREM|nr:unnamed protein product [Schistosoma margrebowiei]